MKVDNIVVYNIAHSLYGVGDKEGADGDYEIVNTRAEDNAQNDGTAAEAVSVDYVLTYFTETSPRQNFTLTFKGPLRLRSVHRSPSITDTMCS